MLAQAQSPRVRWAGYLSESELADLLAAAGVVLFPYVQTTSSYALSLALAAGCAVLASDLAPFQEIHLQQNCLEVFQTGQAGDLVEKLSRLLKDAKRGQELSRAAQAWAKTHQWKSIARKTRELYQACLRS
jgi:glycosyltransferase involved in cell wall biosynthesis